MLRKTLRYGSLPLVAGLYLTPLHAAEMPTEPGEEIYRQHCASCHDQPEKTKSRSLDSMREMPNTLIEYALTRGRMQQQGAQLSAAEISAVANYVSGIGASGTGYGGA